MSDLISDGKTRVTWVTTIADIAAPTVAELEAGKDWTARITPDGLKADPSTADVDTGSMASTTDTREVGRVSYDIEVTFKRGTTATEDEPWDTLKYGTHGYLVVRRAVNFSTAWTVGDEVEVYPVVCGQRAPIAPAANEVSKFSSPMKVTGAPVTDALVA